MNIKNINTELLPEFNGGWSYETRTIRAALNHTTYVNDVINVLEFGSGDSTYKIYNFLKNAVPVVIYDCYETNVNYINDLPIKNILYKHPSEVVLIDKVYDLILIDGPMGCDRKYWYEKIKPCCRSGTIIVIDDWNHFEEFEIELNKHLKYDIIEICNDKFPMKSYKIVKII